MNHILLYVAVNGFLVPFADASPSFENGHVLVPARPVLQKLKAQISNTEDEVEVKASGKTVTLQVGSKNFSVDSRSYQFPVAPRRRSGQLFIPLRSFVEALGGRVSWSNQFGPYRFVGIAVPGLPVFKSPYRNHWTYSPDWLFAGRNVTLNATVKRFTGTSDKLFEAVTDDGILLHVYAGVNVGVKTTVGATIRMSGYLQAGSDGTFKAHNIDGPDAAEGYLKNSGIAPIGFRRWLNLVVA